MSTNIARQTAIEMFLGAIVRQARKTDETSIVALGETLATATLESARILNVNPTSLSIAVMQRVAEMTGVEVETEEIQEELH